MSFIIEKVEIIPYKCKKYETIGFKPVPIHSVCCIVPAIVVNILNRMDSIEVEFQGYIYKYTEDRTIIYSKVLNPRDDSYEYYRGQKSIEIIKNYVGKEMIIENLPCVNYSDPNTDLPAYTIEKDTIKLYSRVRTGRMFGNIMYKTQLLANIYITGPDNRKIIDYCDRCGFKYE